MKKWAYLLSGILIGAVVTTTGSATAAQIKSLVGQKVTDELNVVINGQKLQDKGAVIAGKTSAPVRAISDAIGGKLTLKDDTIYIVTDNVDSSQVSSGTDSGGRSASSNKYIGGSKSSLETLRDSIENDRIKPAIEGKEYLEKQIAELKKGGDSGTSIGVKEKELKEIEDIITKANEELRLVEEALQALEK